ncbi:RNA polymerase recycling motor HelD [Priestia koreensis]|uniref:RNA polymerase recycling motor HelD n=1 Tax=Priestia koreensis TaxID=284581 RepID=UPI0028F729F7|nr:RNA polymerase recycling motor HelD [Priestia koreensis]
MRDVTNEMKLEMARIERIKSEISHKETQLLQGAGGVQEDILHLRKNFWEDVTVNTDEPDDLIETHASIKQQAEMLAERERSHGQATKQIKTLSKLKNSPYFGRIDFVEDGEEQVEDIYIGVASLMDRDDQEFLIYDWRAPISSLYYDYSPGYAEYETPTETIHGEMVLKRQYVIKEGKLKNMFDTGITIGDQMLQEVLSNQANQQMKSIVATIQKEQNEIIRNERSKTLIVQGVAGSGKTSAALQRIAYLLYRHRNSLQSSNIMLFSPNLMFNSYVATVLPELGEDNMQQDTFQKYMERKISRRIDVESPFEQVEYVLTGQQHSQYTQRIKNIDLKSSITFKGVVDQFIEGLSNGGLVFRHIKFRGELLLSAEEIEHYFYSLDRAISIPNRMDLVATWLKKKLRQFEKEQVTKDWVLEEVELSDKETYLRAYRKLQNEQRSTDDTFDDFEQEQALLARELVKKKFKPLYKQVQAMRFVNEFSVYRRLNQMLESIEDYQEIGELTQEYLKRGVLLYEDMTPYLYLQDRLKGKSIDPLIKHLFIDEAQDYNAFQMAYLQYLFPHAKMTLLGDFNQAVYAHSRHKKTLLEELHEEDQARIELTQSYRSTKQIVEFTRSLIPNGEAIKPFNRNGLLPAVTEIDEKNSIYEQIKSKIITLKKENHETIAIICKTEKECKEVMDLLANDFEIKRITPKTQAFERGILVMPIYLAKGIEFDAVLIYDGSNENYGSSFDRYLLYTACTRAMHELHIFSIGKKSKWIEAVPNALYIEE